jgi:hypothetical protein
MKPKNIFLENLRILVRNALISRFGESYHEISWHVGIVFGSRLPFRITIGEVNHRISWADTTAERVFRKFSVNLSEIELNQGDNLDHSFTR